MSLSTGESLTDYLVRLSKTSGIQKLSGGAFSQVFQHPAKENVVVKVVSNLDISYNAYLTWCTENQHNPFVPRILESWEYPDAKEPFRILFLEKLKKFANGAHFARRLTKLFKFPSDEVRNETLGLLKHIIKTDNQSIFIHKLIDLAEDFDAPEEFKDVIYFIEGQFSIGDFDLHWCNAMLRGNQIVITDPVASNVDWDKYVGDIA